MNKSVTISFVENRVQKEVGTNDARPEALSITLKLYISSFGPYFDNYAVATSSGGAAPQ
jgi:hypothetical protein